MLTVVKAPAQKSQETSHTHVRAHTHTHTHPALTHIAIPSSNGRNDAPRTSAGIAYAESLCAVDVRK